MPSSVWQPWQKNIGQTRLIIFKFSMSVFLHPPISNLFWSSQRRIENHSMKIVVGVFLARLIIGKRQCQQSKKVNWQRSKFFSRPWPCHSSQPDNEEVMGLIPAGLCFAFLSIFMKAQVFKAARCCNLNCEKLSLKPRREERRHD